MGYIYNFILQFAAIIILFAMINKEQTFYHDTHKPAGRFLFFFFALVFLYSLYTGFGGDNDRYREFVEGGYQNFYYLEFFSFEELYVKIAEYTRNFILWKIVVYGSAIILSILSIKRLEADNLITLYAFALIPMSSYGSTRAVLAYSIYLFGYTFLNDNRIYKHVVGWIIIYLSWLAHSSMILPIILTPLTYLKITKARMYILIALFPAFVVLFNHYYMMFLGSSAIGDTMSAGKFEVYSEGGYATATSTTSSILRFLFGFVLVPPVLIGMRGIYSETIDNRFHRVIKLSFLMVYMSFVMFFSELDNITFFNRYFTMIPFFLYIAMSGISLEPSISPSIRKKYWNFVLLYSIVEMLYLLYCTSFV